MCVCGCVCVCVCLCLREREKEMRGERHTDRQTEKHISRDVNDMHFAYSHLYIDVFNLKQSLPARQPGYL